MLPRTLLALGLIVCGIGSWLHAQDRSRGGRDAKTEPAIRGAVIDYTCPKCNHVWEGNTDAPPTACPKCQVKLTAIKSGDGFNLQATESEANPLKKYLLWGGGILLVVGLIGVLLKYTVFAAPPPKKKKKKRPSDNDDDDRPRKKKPPVVMDDDDEEDDRPRKKKPLR